MSTRNSVRLEHDSLQQFRNHCKLGQIGTWAIWALFRCLRRARAFVPSSFEPNRLITCAREGSFCVPLSSVTGSLKGYTRPGIATQQPKLDASASFSSSLPVLTSPTPTPLGTPSTARAVHSLSQSYERSPFDISQDQRPSRETFIAKPTLGMSSCVPVTSEVVSTSVGQTVATNILTITVSPVSEVAGPQRC